MARADFRLLFLLVFSGILYKKRQTNIRYSFIRIREVRIKLNHWDVRSRINVHKSPINKRNFEHSLNSMANMSPNLDEAPPNFLYFLSETPDPSEHNPESGI